MSACPPGMGNTAEMKKCCEEKGGNYSDVNMGTCMKDGGTINLYGSDNSVASFPQVNTGFLDMA